MSKQVIEAIPELEGKSYEEIAQWFNFQEMIENPEKQGEIPVKLTVAKLLALIEPRRAVLLVSTVIYSLAKEAYLSGDLETALAYLKIMKESETVTDKEHDLILKEISKTIPDPSYQKEIPGPPRYVALGVEGPVTAIQVQEWLNV